MTETKPTQLHAIVHGRVQGVGFRDYTQRCAADLGLSGWVSNRADGTVEVIAEGERAVLDRLLTLLNRGPTGARVLRVDVEWRVASGYRDFYVR